MFFPRFTSLLHSRPRLSSEILSSDCALPSRLIVFRLRSLCDILPSLLYWCHYTRLCGRNLLRAHVVLPPYILCCVLLVYGVAIDILGMGRGMAAFDQSVAHFCSPLILLALANPFLFCQQCDLERF